MARFAQNTSVSGENSRAEIERTVRRYGATGYGYVWDDSGTRAMIEFRIADRRVRFILTMPALHDPEFTETPHGRERSTESALKAWEQACRQRWRALALMIKAKLEGVESGIVTLEEEFLAHLVCSDGKTVGETVIPQYIEQIESGGPVPLLLSGA